MNAVQESGILPEETLYHGETLALQNPRGAGKRQSGRLNEKNGVLEPGGAGENQRLRPRIPGPGQRTGDGQRGTEHGPGREYAFHTELNHTSAGQSLIIHHHLSRRSKSLQQVHRKQRGIYEKLGRRAFIMRYHRGSQPGSPRAFILIPQDGHRREILERTGRCSQDRGAGTSR